MYTEIKDISRVKEIVKVIAKLSYLSEDVIVEKLVESGALLDGHWRLLSGKHSSIFLKFRRIAEKCNNGFLGLIAKELTDKFKSIKIDVVLGPETAGALLVDKVSAELNVRPALVKADKDGRPLSKLLLNSEINEGDNVLIINDLVTTGKGLKNLISLVESKKANIAGIGLFATRDQSVIERLCSKVPNIQVLITMDIKHYDPHSCELCQKKVELEKGANHN